MADDRDLLDDICDTCHEREQCKCVQVKCPECRAENKMGPHQVESFCVMCGAIIQIDE